ncbi:MAG TPA: CTP synthase [Candidatus Parcubacteria bacterium]|nr:CTP synthase [Candidatus Parcubacteria bacterium]
MPKYIFVAGGVMSGIGKGIAVSSIGRILKDMGFKVTAIKIDPYVNVDAGTMNPVEHGEVFVTDDGLECDQDIGNYERFLDENIYDENYLTTGKVYQAVINRERNLGYGGRCVEVVPDIPNEVIDRIKKAARKTKADFVLIEIGGTVGEYQNMLFLEAARMMKLGSKNDVLFILVSYLPIPRMIGEMKTKPTQYAVRTLNSAGIQPDIVLGRSAVALDDVRKRKISVFCNLDVKDIISAPDINSIYEVPVNFEKDRLGERILRKLGVGAKKKKNFGKWNNLVKNIRTSKKPVKIGIVGKYFKTGKFTLTDSYISVIEAIKHASYFFKLKPEVYWLSAGQYEKSPRQVNELKKYDGIIVPGGFGDRGVKGKIEAIRFCRENKIPFFGLCLGMQLAVIEFARNVCGLKEACSTEFSKCKEPVIDVMPEQKDVLKNKRYGGTMRLGAYDCRLSPGTKSFQAYGGKKSPFIISERHRHRYELNNDYQDILKKNGLVFAGVNPKQNLVEIVEIKNHPFFVATQFHPEFKSRPLNPHPLFKEFISAAAKNKK